MPEALELSLGGGERGGVAVPEADDGDPSEEVDIRAPVRVDERPVLPVYARQDLTFVRGEGATNVRS